MKVLVFVKTFAQPTLTFIYNEIKGIAEHVEVKVICLKRLNSDKFPYDNVEVLPNISNSILNKILHPFQTRNFLFSYKDKKIKSRIDNIVNDFKPDIIHTHFGFESWWFLANLPLTKIPVFISFHGFDASHMLKSRRYISLVKHFKDQFGLSFIFCSKLMAEEVEVKTGTINKKHILYYGTDISFFKRTNYYISEPFTFLQISSFAEKKGHEYTVKAFCLFRNQHPDLNIKLILAGEGDLRVEIIQLCKDLQLTGQVEFPGLVTPLQAKELMNNSQVFVHHSITSAKGDKEGIPNAIMEAMSMEMPVVSTFHSGIPELVEDQINGYLVKEKDIEGYALKFKQSMDLGYLSRNREKVKANFERKQHTQYLLDIYRSELFHS